MTGDVYIFCLDEKRCGVLKFEFLFPKEFPSITDLFDRALFDFPNFLAGGKILLFVEMLEYNGICN